MRPLLFLAHNERQIYFVGQRRFLRMQLDVGWIRQAVLKVNKVHLPILVLIHDSFHSVWFAIIIGILIQEVR